MSKEGALRETEMRRVGWRRESKRDQGSEHCLGPCIPHCAVLIRTATGTALGPLHSWIGSHQSFTRYSLTQNCMLDMQIYV